MNRLTLKRDYCSESDDLMNNISDDNCIDLTSPQKDTEYECANIRRHQKDLSVIKPTINTACNSKHVHDDLSSDEDIIITACTSKTRESMFTWNKTAPIMKPQYQTNTTENQTLFEANTKPKKKLYNEMRYEKRKRMSSSDDSMEEDTRPEVAIQHERMIGGVTVKFPAKPYPCQMAVMNMVSAMILQLFFVIFLCYVCINYIENYMYS